ncbi:MAG: ABC transporter substrate-binding protein [Gammaproteobacteria bacterium]|nr:MAG: ABC transporter substrate-binding protein [Gammaproteobacteria bacterium]
MKQFVLILILGFMSSAAMAQEPNDVIQETADELAAALDGRKEELAADKVALYSMIDGILLPRFDRRYAAQLVLGRPWRDATAEQRERFIAGFYSSMLRRYANGVLEFDQSKMEILPFRGDLEKKRTTVKTIVRLNDGTKVPVNYEMVKRDSGWMMFDVKIEGISYIRNFKTEINAEIQATSLDAVIERLEMEAQVAA